MGLVVRGVEGRGSGSEGVEGCGSGSEGVEGRGSGSEGGRRPWVW